MSVYLHDWASSGQEGMLSDFGIGPEALDGVEVIIASYTYENYSGDAYVLFRKGGKLFEVHGGHCSCHGLESQDHSNTGGTQWEPEETNAGAIMHRIEHGTWGEEAKVRDRVKEALDRLADNK